MSKRFGRNRRRKMRMAVETLTSEVVHLRNANQHLNEKLERVGEELGRFNATTHKDFLKALAEAGKDPMQPSHTLSGRGVLK